MVVITASWVLNWDLTSIHPLFLITGLSFYTFIFLLGAYAFHRKKMALFEGQKKELLYTTIRMMELDNKRIAKNVHDDVGSILSLAKLNLDYLISLSENNAVKKQVAEEVMPLMDQAIENSKYITSDLMPTSLAKLGFEKAFINLCSLLSKNQSVIIRCDFKGNGFQFSDLVQQKIYRISKEVLANILKHSNSKEINISFITLKESYTIHFRHYGKGISNEEIELLKKEAKGVGLTSIFNRLECLDASINYVSGVTPEITIQIPLI